jgi:hypothetical protein
LYTVRSMDYRIVRKEGVQDIVVQVPYVLCAGWAGRSQEKVREHIEELVKLGVAAPKETPILFSVTSDLLTTGHHVDVQGKETSGEVEYVLIDVDGEWFVTVGSDQTDREAEKFGVEKSKQLSPKITGRTLWPLSEVADHWDALHLTAWVTKHGKREVYQDEDLSAIITWQTLLDLVNKKLPGCLPQVPIFSGTIPTHTGLVFHDVYEMELRDPVLNRSIYHKYTVTSLNEVLGV